MLNLIKNIYETLPKNYLKFLKYIPDRVLFGKSYVEWKDKVSFDKNIIDKNLYEMLNYAREHTLYGKENIPKDFYIDESKKVLEELPLVSSYDVATNFEYFISDEYNKFNSYKTTTGGSGRNPTTVLLSNESYGIEWAHVHFIWNKVGYNRKKLKLTLRGKVLRNNKLCEYNPIYNELVVDTFKVNKDNFSKLLKEIKKYNIQYIHGYPSLIKEWIEYFKMYNLNLNLKGILLASEKADIKTKKYIADFFHCKVLSFYGQTEK
jgi:phenylacetate-CoA ligase